MSWQDDEDRKRRSKVASELDRREFWKDCFKISLEAHTGSVDCASRDADEALCAFDARFMKEIK